MRTLRLRWHNRPFNFHWVDPKHVAERGLIIALDAALVSDDSRNDIPVHDDMRSTLAVGSDVVGGKLRTSDINEDAVRPFPEGARRRFRQERPVELLRLDAVTHERLGKDGCCTCDRIQHEYRGECRRKPLHARRSWRKPWLEPHHHCKWSK